MDTRLVKVAHDPGDPQLTSHCPFCGSGQVTGRSDGGIDCAFCGMSFIVRVQPAFPGMPQAPGMGAPTDIGPDPGAMMGMGPMDAMPPGAGPDEGMPPGAEGDGFPPGEEDGEEGPPFGDGGDDGDEDGQGPPGSQAPGESDDSGNGPPGKGKKQRKKSSARRYRTLAGDVLDEARYIRHLAVAFSGADPRVLATLRREAAATGDRAEYTRHYARGWSASVRAANDRGYGPSALERADDRGEHKAWYEGYHDHATGRPKFHSRDCPGPDHDAPGCTLWDEPPARHGSRRTAAVINPGAIVQYRKVGQARVGEHNCPPGSCSDSSSSHSYQLEFLTGPKAYRDRGMSGFFWLGPENVVRMKSHREDPGIRQGARRGYTDEDDEGFAWPTYYDHETGEHEIDESSAPRCGTCSRYQMGDVHHWPEDGHEDEVQRHVDREQAFYDRMDRGEYDSSKFCNEHCEEGYHEDLKRGIMTHHTFSPGEPEWADNPPARGDEPGRGSPYGEPPGRQPSGYEVRNPAAERRCHYCRSRLPAQQDYRATPGSVFEPFDPAGHARRTHQTLSSRTAHWHSDLDRSRPHVIAHLHEMHGYGPERVKNVMLPGLARMHEMDHMRRGADAHGGYLRDPEAWETSGDASGYHDFVARLVS